MRKQLLVRSSLVESARADIARTQFLLRRAEVEPIPNVIVNSGYQWAASGNHSQALVGVYFTMPIWDRNQGNIRAAGANVRQSVAAQLNTVQNELLRQLADALARYRSAEISVETYEKSILPDARRTLDLVQKGYREPSSSISCECCRRSARWSKRTSTSSTPCRNASTRGRRDRRPAAVVRLPVTAANGLA